MTRSAHIARVVVGVDFDEASTGALMVASALASAGEAAVTLLHATTLEMPAYFTSAQMALEEERQQDCSRLADLRAFAAPHIAGPIDRVQDADFVVVSSGFQSGGNRRSRGLVDLLKDCPHPVLLVPPADQTVERSSS
jgi:Universal stress protein family